MGFSFEWFGGEVVILPECMGFRSLRALLPFALYLMWGKGSKVRTAVLAILLAVALSVAGNILRVASILLLALVSRSFAFGFWHQFAGYPIFVAELFLLAAICERLNRRNTNG